jgi:hypothetical protein
VTPDQGAASFLGKGDWLRLPRSGPEGASHKRCLSLLPPPTAPPRDVRLAAAQYGASPHRRPPACGFARIASTQQLSGPLYYVARSCPNPLARSRQYVNHRLHRRPFGPVKFAHDDQLGFPCSAWQPLFVGRSNALAQNLANHHSSPISHPSPSSHPSTLILTRLATTAARPSSGVARGQWLQCATTLPGHNQPGATEGRIVG